MLEGVAADRRDAEARDAEALGERRVVRIGLEDQLVDAGLAVFELDVEHLRVERILPEIDRGGELAGATKQLERGRVDHERGLDLVAVREDGVERGKILVAREREEEVGLEAAILDAEVSDLGDDHADLHVGRSTEARMRQRRAVLALTVDRHFAIAEGVLLLRAEPLGKVGFGLQHGVLEKTGVRIERSRRRGTGFVCRAGALSSRVRRGRSLAVFRGFRGCQRGRSGHATRLDLGAQHQEAEDGDGRPAQHHERPQARLAPEGTLGTLGSLGGWHGAGTVPQAVRRSRSIRAARRFSADHNRSRDEPVSPRLLILAALALAACRPKTEEPAPAKALGEEIDVALSERALEAARLAFAKPVSAPRQFAVTVAGSIEFTPSRVARIGPSIAGRVSSVPVAPGQKIAKGAQVVTIESVELGRAQAELTIAKSNAEVSVAELEREKRRWP
ncbi:MAG: hypothetical protein EOP08_03480 [Proteobacteria bacterium]|nr:MAG: hypothetical protein EOP08_03480 [Pseudomonadota bacterium]